MSFSNTYRMIVALFAVLSCFFSFQVQAQSTFPMEGMNYQAIARDASGDPIPDQIVSLQFKIWRAIIVQYEETQSVTTNEHGLFTAVIGNGTSTGGGVVNDIDEIDWEPNTSFRIHVLVDFTGGSNYSLLGNDLLRSVPFAQHAHSADLFTDSAWVVIPDSQFVFAKQGYKVGIGISEPKAILDVADQAIIDGLKIGQGAGDQISNTALGKDVLNDNTTGSWNTAIGYQVLKDNTVGDGNTAVGLWAMTKNTTGYRNTAVGTRSLTANETGAGNTVVGDYAMLENTTGGSNTAIGVNSMNKNISGGFNTACGEGTLYRNTTGQYNTCVGSGALTSNISASNNTAIGRWSMFFNTTGHSNSALGTNSLFANTSGHSNSAVGMNALISNTSGYFNTAIGLNSLNANITGHTNSALGVSALYLNTTGQSNTASGYLSMRSNIDGSNNTVNGVEALYSNISGNSNSALGFRALYQNNSGGSNTALGFEALRSNTTGGFNVAVGSKALEYLSGSSNVGVGRNSGPTSATSGENNSYLGPYSSSTAGVTLNFSAAIGENAIFSATDQIRVGTSFTASIGGYRAWTNLSDGRLKKNIAENVSGLDLILKLRPVTYQLDHEAIIDFDYKSDPELAAERKTMIAERGSTARETGFIAQEVETAMKELGIEFSGLDAPDNENDKYGLRYAVFVVPLVKAVQEQQKLIEDQQRTIEELQANDRTMQEEVRSSLERMEVLARKAAGH